MFNYNADAVHERLQALDRRQKAMYAAACTERLMPLGQRGAQELGLDFALLRTTLDDLWSAAEGGSSELPESTLQPERDEVEALIPHDDSLPTDQVFGVYFMPAAPALCYSVDAWLNDDAADAERAPYYVYETADLIARKHLRNLKVVTPRSSNKS